MTTIITEHEVRMLELELRKLELNRQIRQLKADPSIDGECIGCAGPCGVVDVAAKLQDSMEQIHANRKAHTHHLNSVINDLTSQLTETRAINNEITRLRVEEVETRQGLEAELSAREEDYKVLMAVVDIVNDWDDESGRAFPTLYDICDLLVDYLGVQEPPIKEDDSSIDEEHCITVKVGLLEL